MNPPAARLPVNCDVTTGWTQRAAAALGARIARWYFALDVRGLEHLPAGEACLLCANHASHVDTFALASGTRRHSARLVFLAADDYFFRFRWRSWLLRRLICLLPFERGQGMAAAKHNLRILGECRDAGRIIVLFPEGTRSPDGRMRGFKPGAAMFADRLGLRVVPCHIEGAHAALPKGKRLPRRREVRVTFAAPLTIPPAAPQESPAERVQRYTRFAARVQLAVGELGDRASHRETALIA